MKRVFLTLLLLLASTMSPMAAQQPDAKEQANKIAKAIAVPLYGYDTYSVTSVIETMVNDNDAIRAVEIIDANSEAVIFEAYKTDDNTFHTGKPIPEEQKNKLQQLVHPVVHEQEEIGELHLYYLPGGESDLKLTTEERAWIRANPELKVGNEMDWPPFDFAENGEPKGYSIDLINLIGEKAGLKFEFINGYTWSELLEKFKAGEIDIMPAIYVDEQRKTYIAFTDRYFSQPSVIVVKKDRSDIEKISDLSGKKLAVIEGFVITNAIEKSHPDIQRVPMKGVVEAITAVSLGQVDAFIDSIGVISTTIEKNFIPNIKIIDDTSLKDVENPALHIGVSRDKPILRNILDKGLHAVTREEMKTIREKWIQGEMGVTEAPEYDWIWLIGIVIVIFLILSILIRYLTKISGGRQLELSFGSLRFRAYAIIGLSLLITVVSVLGWLTLQHNKRKILTDVQANLENVLITTNERLDNWIDQRKFFMQQLGRNPELVARTEQLLKVEPYRDTLLTSAALADTRNFFEANKDVFGDIGFFIINPDFISVGSQRDVNTGSMNIIVVHRPDLMERIFKGETIFVPPITSDVVLDRTEYKDTGLPPTMFFATPIHNADGTIIAALAKRVDPAQDFSRVLQFSRVGESGETYAFGQDAKLLSASRFDDDLRQIGLISKDRNAILNIEIRDPGGNMVEGYRPEVRRSDQPLTRMAASAIQMKADHENQTQQIEHSAITTDMTGYPDYRGVPVFGAWQWDVELDMGLTSEIDVAEALATYYTMRMTVLGVLGTTLFLFVGATLFILILGERANKALSLARDDLEKRVEERTAELKENQDQLERAEERSRLLLESAGEGIFGVGENELVNFINPAGLKMLGFKAHEVIGRKIHPLIHHTHADGTPYPVEECPMHHSLVEGAISDIDDEVLWRKDDTSFPVEYTSVPIRKDGSVIGTVVMFRDITERKQAEEELQKLSSAVEQSPVSVVITDPDGTIEYVNPKFVEVTGYSAEEAIGQNPRVLNAGIQPSEFYKEMWDTLKAGDVWQGEFANKKRNGDIFWENATIAPIRNSEGQVTHFVAVKEDITARKRAEKELKKAKETAEEATRAKSDFLANMSHEIRTPMNAVIGLSDLCLRTDLSPKQNDYLVKIHSSANSLLGIINDILDFSKIEAGKLDMESIPFELDKVLNNLATVISVKTEEKGLELLFSRHQDVPLNLMGDPLRLGQILTNLANNAVKFTDNGEIIVSITLNERSEKICTLEFRVKDSGIGMSAEQQSRLFKSFSQADTSTTRKYGGTGLGLAISKQLVELMGGTIWVESELEKGSTFAFTAEFSIAELQQKTPLMPSPDLRGIKVLVVDDNENARIILTDYLEQFSFSVDQARTGEEALALIKESAEPFRLVMLDYMMPGLNGIETARKIHETYSESDIKMILVSSLNHAEYADDPGFELLDSYLSKPTNPSLLFNVIMEVFGRLDVVDKKSKRHAGDMGMASLQAIRGARILLVEDNKINQQVATELLEQAGFNVDIANNGQEALDMIEEVTYDCLLMDVQMPVMDGYTATAKIREREEYSDLPVLAMTANALAEDKERALEAGMNDHLTKPINPDNLFKALVNWIGTEGHEFDTPPPQANVSESAVETNLPDSLPGLDIEAGVRKVGGNAVLYTKLLQDFLMDHKEDIPAIHKAIELQDFATAQRLSHTLKGVGATIGANDLQRTAERLESAFKDKSIETIHQVLPSFEQAMNRVISGLEQHTKSEPTDDNQTAAVDPADLLQMLEQLHNLLDEMDPEAEELANQIRHQIGSSKITRGLSTTLTKQVSGFEFEEAQETLQALREKIEETINDRG